MPLGSPVPLPSSAGPAPYGAGGMQLVPELPQLWWGELQGFRLCEMGMKLQGCVWVRGQTRVKPTSLSFLG